MNKVLKINFLLIGIASISSLSSCSKSLDIRYQEITEEGKAAVEWIKGLGWKEEFQYGDKWEKLWAVARARSDTFLKDSFKDALNAVSDGAKAAFSKNQPLIHNGCETYYIDPDSGNYERVILFLHGGAYLNNILTFHIESCYELSNKFNARVYVPIYPLAPKSTYHDCYAFLDNLYINMVNRENDKDFIFMGDSAGGGLALAYSQYLFQEGKNIKLPIARVCFSPWCDVTMSNPDIVDKLEEDIFLAPFGLGVVGNYWAANTEPTNYKISPYFGKLNDKIDTLCFSGSAEIFLSDITRTCKKLKDNGCRTRLVIGNGLFHTYPMLSILPESKEAFDIAYDFVINHR